MDKKEINRLLEAYKNNSLTPEEQVKLYRMLSGSSNSDVVKEWIAQAWESEKLDDLLSAEQSGTLYKDIRESLQTATSTPRTYRIHRFVRFIAAASIFIALLAGSYFLYTGQKTPKQENYIVDAKLVGDIEPPSVNRASITLSDGKVLYLDSLNKEQLPQQEGVEIIRLDNGELQYKGATQEVITNTLTNPRGSKTISITLADGTGITLNAGSRITYPLSFLEDVRKVKLTGEAYFSVAPYKDMPFVVSVNSRVEVKVLGTQFNIKAYEDDSYASVTLVEGLIEVAKNLEEKLEKQHRLYPGQQANFDNKGLVTINRVDTDEFTAWKDDMFYFNDVELESIMKSLSRWYDLDVLFTDSALKSITFGALISRKSNISEIFKLMEMTESVYFNISDKKVIVKKGKSSN